MTGKDGLALRCPFDELRTSPEPVEEIKSVQISCFSVNLRPLFIADCAQLGLDSDFRSAPKIPPAAPDTTPDRADSFSHRPPKL